MHVDMMAPAISEIIFVEDVERLFFVIGEGKINQAGLGSLEGAMVEQAVFVELRRAEGQTANEELVQVAVSPAESGLEHLVELGEVETNGEFEGADNPWLNPNDMDLNGTMKESRSNGSSMGDGPCREYLTPTTDVNDYGDNYATASAAAVRSAADAKVCFT